MDNIRQYLLSIISAAILCSIVVMFADKKNLTSAMLKLLAGLFMSITVISPLVKFKINDFTAYLEKMEIDGQVMAAYGQEAAAKEKSLIIKQKAEAYILDKAASLGISVEADIMLSDSGEALPHTVNLKGDASPYVRQQLQNMIAEELGIPKERQSWS